MAMRHISLNRYTDTLIGNNTETKAIICGVLSAPNGNGKMSIGFMRKANAILDAIDALPTGAEVLLLAEDQWALLAGCTSSYHFPIGGRAVLAAIDDILNAIQAEVEERPDDTSP